MTWSAELHFEDGTVEQVELTGGGAMPSPEIKWRWGTGEMVMLELDIPAWRYEKKVIYWERV